ncbi:MmcQ/YjbR family DNA-binding protein [Asticcacaulis sp. AND118]|uniref:MmcQ/YjbR family DNA-binding protein n=1 Tax=Asticcacaulis sp. AND118 TaxID=2840468 RepID=UPI001CFF77C2|nr:MmcQ/YjbR family DNA-binding protein [Asticcacaulis sp. AND118]UDF04971.1 MmcQ/YjbR family DNA-binding protein [Asticcacaulis sp. AND118]
MLTFERLRDIILRYPDTEETMSWDSRSFKVNGKAMLFWNPAHDAPVFKVPFEERDFLLEVDPDTFFTTDHHRPWPLVLARPDRVDIGWVEANIDRVWRAQVKKRTLKLWDAQPR